MITRYILLFLLAILGANCLIKANNSSEAVAYDTNYVKSYNNYISFNVISSTKKFEFQLENVLNSKKMMYAPSPYLANGIEIDTKLAGISYTPSFLTIYPNKSKYGNTIQHDLKFNLNLNPIFIDLNLLLYTGFYLKNTNDYKWTNLQTEYSTEPNMTCLSIGANLFYVHNHKKFSFSAPFNYGLTQKKSAGSLIMGLSYYFFGIEKDSSIVPTQIIKQVDLPNSPYLISASYMTGNIGYGHTFVIKRNLYISNTLLFGSGVSEIDQTYYSSPSLIDKNQLTIQLMNRLGLGYDNGNWYVGINSFYNDYIIIDKSTLLIEFDRLDFKLFLGKRFNYKKLIAGIRR